MCVWLAIINTSGGFSLIYVIPPLMMILIHHFMYTCCAYLISNHICHKHWASFQFYKPERSDSQTSIDMNTTNRTGKVLTNMSTIYPPAGLILKTCAPVLIIAGTFANILAILVLTRPWMRGNNTVFYLIVLSVGDILVLNTGPLYQWIKVTFDYNIRNYSQFMCKGHAYLDPLLLHLTTWLLVAVIVDWCICVCKQFAAKTLRSMCNSWLVASIMSAIFVLVHIVFILDFNLENVDGSTECQKKRQSNRLENMAGVRYHNVLLHPIHPNDYLRCMHYKKDFNIRRENIKIQQHSKQHVVKV